MQFHVNFTWTPVLCFEMRKPVSLCTRTRSSAEEILGTHTHKGTPDCTEFHVDWKPNRNLAVLYKDARQLISNPTENVFWSHFCRLSAHVYAICERWHFPSVCFDFLHTHPQKKERNFGGKRVNYKCPQREQTVKQRTGLNQKGSDL